MTYLKGHREENSSVSKSITNLKKQKHYQKDDRVKTLATARKGRTVHMMNDSEITKTCTDT